MRLCRFELDDLSLVGFYRDDSVIALEQAAEIAADVDGLDLMMGASDDLLDYLGPDGPIADSARELWNWVEALPPDQREELQTPVSDVRLLVPVENPPTVQTGTVVNCTSGVNVRSGPGTSYSIIGTAPKGATYTVTGQSGSWYKINFGGKTGRRMS